MRWTAAGLMLLLSACSSLSKPQATSEAAPPPVSGHASVAGSANVAVSGAPSSASTSEPVTATDRKWVDAIRAGRWREAKDILGKLAPAKLGQPRIRYVRARVAVEMGDFQAAEGLVGGLEQQLPSLATDIRALQADIAVHLGHQDVAAQIWQQSRRSSDWLAAADAWAKMGRWKNAKAQIDRVSRAWRRVKSPRRQMALRMLRARIAQALGDKAAAVSDWQYVCLHGPDWSKADEAERLIHGVKPRWQLTSEQREARAAQMADAGNYPRTVAELGLMAHASGHKPSKQRRLQLEARAAYRSRSRYRLAAQRYEAAAKLRGPRATSCLYYAAKAWTRADEDVVGLRLYRRLMRRHPKSEWADRASYYSARLAMLHGHWLKASARFERYLQRYRHGRFVRAARYNRALCWLLSGKVRLAAKALAKLVDAQHRKLDRANLRYLAALASYQSGNKTRAYRQWRGLAADFPLSWFALVSTARLKHAGQPVPTLLPPGKPPKATVQASPHVSWPLDVVSLHEMGFDQDAERHLRAAESAMVKAWSPSMRPRARCALYESIGSGARLHQIAQIHVPVSLVNRSIGPDNRWAWRCMYPRPYGQLTSRLEGQEQLPAGLLFAIMRQESAFRATAKSAVGARGLMQLMPSTARKTATSLGMSLTDEMLDQPPINIRLGAHYVSILLKMFDESVPVAVASYNAGPHAVFRWLQRGKHLALDLWVAQIPYAETRRYVWRVMGNLARYQYLQAGSSAVTEVSLSLPKTVSISRDAY